MELLWMALLAGAMAFPHCLGMCGGFSLYLSGGQTRGAALGRQLLWHSGRIVTYVFLGALAGFLGRAVNLAQWPMLREVPGYLAGGLMVLMGLFVLGVFPSKARRAEADNDGLFSAIVKQFFQKPTPSAALTLGLANGFLPCPITVGFLGLAAQSASVGVGMATMACLGVGTIWSLLIVGVVGWEMKAGLRRFGGVVLGIVLIAMGTWTVLRKTHVLPPLPGTPTLHKCC